MTEAIINIRSRFDPRSGQQIILWNDIVKVFKHAEYVQHANTFVPYLANDDFEDMMGLKTGSVKAYTSVFKPKPDWITFRESKYYRTSLVCPNKTSQSGELMVLSRSDIPLSAFSSAIIANATCVTELIIDLQSEMTASEFRSLQDAVLIFELSSLNIRNLGFIVPAAAERRSVPTLNFNADSNTDKKGPVPFTTATLQHSLAAPQ
ncbi:hypothetical protein KI688_005188 [Linnemannia hyalina]|uniref:Uncharacterized protein n=1 Tax=Linnemannia hyalina TaxID=64524 RepID=A0A9P7XNP3_9FUNG|nr:hypothetical protein KI688_005188 [Linnemannia hyalina]